MKTSLRRGVFSAAANTVGTMIYYFALWIITMIISKISLKNYYDVGIFSVAMSYGNIFFAVATFGVRGYQVSDIHHQYRDTQYYVFRMLTCLGATMACIICVLVLGYRGEILLAITVYMVFQAIDAYSDLFYGYSQVNGYLEYAGFSMAIKGLIICGLFTFLLIITQSLVVAMLSLIISTLFMNLFYDQRKARKLCGLERMSFKEFISEITEVKGLFIACLPLMLNSLIMPLLIAVPRLLIEIIYNAPEYTGLYGDGYGAELLGVYTAVSAPSVIISTFVSAVALPLIPFCAKAWQSRNVVKIMKVVFLPAISVMLCCTLGIPFILSFGGNILRILYTSQISSYVDLLVISVITSCILACVILFNNMLISMRRIRVLLFFTMTACILVCVTSMPFIKLWGIYGAAFSLAFAYVVELLLQILFIVYNMFCIKKIKI